MSAPSYWWASVDATTETFTLETLNRAMEEMKAASERYYLQQVENWRLADQFRQSIPEHLKGDLMLDMVAHRVGQGVVWPTRAVEAIRRYIETRQEPMGVEEFMEIAGPLPAEWFLW